MRSKNEKESFSRIALFLFSQLLPNPANFYQILSTFINFCQLLPSSSREINEARFTMKIRFTNLERVLFKIVHFFCEKNMNKWTSDRNISKSILDRLSPNFKEVFFYTFQIYVPSFIPIHSALRPYNRWQKRRVYLFIIIFLQLLWISYIWVFLESWVHETNNYHIYSIVQLFSWGQLQ